MPTNVNPINANTSGRRQAAQITAQGGSLGLTKGTSALVGTILQKRRQKAAEEDAKRARDLQQQQLDLSRQAEGRRAANDEFNRAKSGAQLQMQLLKNSPDAGAAQQAEMWRAAGKPVPPELEAAEARFKAHQAEAQRTVGAMMGQYRSQVGGAPPPQSAGAACSDGT